jgi:hypothetical protein
VDRLDSWLNTQVGWHRAALIWVLLCPPAIAFGCGTWGFWTAWVPGLGLEFLEVAAISVLAAAPLAGLVVLALRRRGSSGRPVFLWRAFAGLLCGLTALMLGQLTDQQSYWLHIHRRVAIAELALMLVGVALWIASVRQYWRLYRGAPPEPRAR